MVRPGLGCLVLAAFHTAVTFRAFHVCCGLKWYHDSSESALAGVFVGAAVDGALPKVHLILGKGAGLVAEHVLDQRQLVVEVGRLDRHVPSLGAHLVVPLHEPRLNHLWKKHRFNSALFKKITIRKLNQKQNIFFLKKKAP
jgi:hypothetical protein